MTNPSTAGPLDSNTHTIAQTDVTKDNKHTNDTF